jgi:hypothetical protein
MLAFRAGAAIHAPVCTGRVTTVSLVRDDRQELPVGLRAKALDEGVTRGLVDMERKESYLSLTGQRPTNYSVETF